MKTINYSLFVALCAILLSGCEAAKLENDNSELSQGKTITITLNASSSDSDEEGTKAGYDASNSYSVWDINDKIGVSVGSNENAEFCQTTPADKVRSTSFSGTLTDPSGADVTLWAKYPYIKGDTFTSSSLTTTLGNQTYQADGYKFPIALAHYKGAVSSSDINDINLKFFNPFTTIKLQIYTQTADAKVSSIIFKGNNAEKIGGEMTFALASDGGVSLDNSAATSESIKLQIPSIAISTSSSTPSVFYITVPNINYTAGFSITVNTTKGMSVKAKSTGTDFSTKGNTIITMSSFEMTPQTIIPDADFRAYLKVQGYIESSDNELVVITPAGLATTVINVHSEAAITDLTGIEYFPALTTLDSGHCSLTTLDVSGCSALVSLSCSSNSSLSSLTLPTVKTKLKELYCEICSLATLDLSEYTALTTLYSSKCSLTSLDVSGCSTLVSLICSSNSSLSSLTLPTVKTSLEYLNCGYCSLVTLDLSEYTALTTLSCSNNPSLTTLDVSGCSALKSLNCATNKLLSSLTLPVVKTSLKELYCGTCKITTLDVSEYSALEILSVSFNYYLHSPVFPTASATIKEFYCAGSYLTALDVSQYSALEKLWCYRNTSLSSLTLPTTKTALKQLFCYITALTALDISGYSALYDLRCYESRLSSLNASGMALTDGNNNQFIIYCGGQKASDGETAQNLTLTLREEQKDRWDTVLKTASYGGNSYNANVTLAP